MQLQAENASEDDKVATIQNLSVACGRLSFIHAKMQ